MLAPRKPSLIASGGRRHRGCVQVHAPDVLVLCHGGPIAMPEDARYVLERVPGLDGFYGASSMERLPTETAITNQTRDFKGLRLPPRKE